MECDEQLKEEFKSLNDQCLSDPIWLLICFAYWSVIAECHSQLTCSFFLKNILSTKLQTYKSEWSHPEWDIPALKRLVFTDIILILHKYLSSLWWESFLELQPCVSIDGFATFFGFASTVHQVNFDFTNSSTKNNDLVVSYKPLYHSAAVSAATENLLEFSLTADPPIFSH